MKPAFLELHGIGPNTGRGLLVSRRKMLTRFLDERSQNAECERVRGNLRRAAPAQLASLLQIIFRFTFTCLLAIADVARAEPIDVLWYTYADSNSGYVGFYSWLAGVVGTYPQTDGNSW